MTIAVNKPYTKSAVEIWALGWDIYESTTTGQKWARKKWLMTEKWLVWTDVLISVKLLESKQNETYQLLKQWEELKIRKIEEPS